MTAIAGIQGAGSQDRVETMLSCMSHRGGSWKRVVEHQNAILGVSGSNWSKGNIQTMTDKHSVQERISSSHYAYARIANGAFELERDPLGVSPLYYGLTGRGELCFASEVKGLLVVTRDVHEFPPGHVMRGSKIKTAAAKRAKPAKTASAGIHQELRRRLENSIAARIGDGNVGSWLSGGIDSTAVAAMARPHVKELHTFVAGLPGSPDVKYSEIASRHIGSTHHVLTVTPESLVDSLPQVIYHLESFDALLIRSTILNFRVAAMASDYVPAVFSGEGADELFAGYEYLAGIPQDELDKELADLVGRLHNTALQRVDRSSAANGLTAYVCFLDQGVVELASQIPVEMKIKDGMEKWILRQAVADLLPDELLYRKKAKFWQGSGVQDHLVRYANAHVTDDDFAREKRLPGGMTLNSKEELLYYRIFRDLFGEFEDLSWMGRTKKTTAA